MLFLSITYLDFIWDHLIIWHCIRDMYIWVQTDLVEPLIVTEMLHLSILIFIIPRLVICWPISNNHHMSLHEYRRRRVHLVFTTEGPAEHTMPHSSALSQHYTGLLWRRLHTGASSLL